MRARRAVVKGKRRESEGRPELTPRLGMFFHDGSGNGALGIFSKMGKERLLAPLWHDWIAFMPAPHAFHQFLNRLCLCCLAILLMEFATAQPTTAALFYKVEKAISLTDSALNPNADGTIPMSVTGLNAAGRMTGYFPSSNGNKLHAFVWDNSSSSLLDLNALLRSRQQHGHLHKR